VIGGSESLTVSVGSSFTLVTNTTYNLWYSEANGLPADLIVDRGKPAQGRSRLRWRGWVRAWAALVLQSAAGRPVHDSGAQAELEPLRTCVAASSALPSLAMTTR
jgi:hypothetical protein